MWWVSSSGQIELQMTQKQANTTYHAGQCIADVLVLMEVPRIKRQLKDIDPVVLRAVLRDYGCWTNRELSSHEDNLERLVFMAAGDIAEEYYAHHSRGS